MKSQRIFALTFALGLSTTITFAQAMPPSSKQPPAPEPKGQVAQTKTGALDTNAVPEKKETPLVIPDRKLTDKGKMDLIRGLNAELGFARTPFPFGKNGITFDVKTGKMNPSPEQVQGMTGGYGASIKAGDRTRITDVRFKGKSIFLEINGGPERKKKWYEHIEISGGGGSVTPGAPTDETNLHGSVVEVAFDKFIPDISTDQMKQLLDPVINFHAKSATEAYLEVIPPAAKKAITDHRALVGMNREMVVYAKGRPPQKTREKDGDVEYEEWIYGVPPQDVEFIRFVGDEVTQVKIMKVDGTKIVRTEKEVDLTKQDHPEVAQQQPGQTPGETAPPQPTTASSDEGPRGRPSLKRPGEVIGDVDPRDAPKTQGDKHPVGGDDPHVGHDPNGNPSPREGSDPTGGENPNTPPKPPPPGVM